MPRVSPLGRAVSPLSSRGPDESCAIPLAPAEFGATPRPIVSTGSMRVTGFRYSSGVEALSVENRVGHVVVLPALGQQVWDAVFHGRRLTMQSVFDEPVLTSDYLSNYGAYLIHCGGSAMGNPGPQDIHALHGELPSVRLNSLRLHVNPATVSRPARIGVIGTATHRRAFDSYFRARLELWVSEGSGVMTTRVNLTNLSGEPRPLMYLAHLNFLPAVGGDLHDIAPAGYDMSVRGNARTSAWALSEPLLAATIHAHGGVYAELLEPSRRVEPELVHVLSHRKPSGMVRFEQWHLDGSTDVVEHDTTSLPYTVRWLRRSADDGAFGFALPATAGPDGFTAEFGRGRVRLYPRDSGIRAVFRHGALAPGETLPPPETLPSSGDAAEPDFGSNTTDEE